MTGKAADRSARAGPNRPTDRVLSGIVEEVRARRDVDLAVHTGDAYESGGEVFSDATMKMVEGLLNNPGFRASLKKDAKPAAQ